MTRFSAAAATAAALVVLAAAPAAAIGPADHLDPALDDAAALLAAFLGNPYVALAGEIVLAASAFVAATRTPDPATRWGRIYRLIELAALAVGRAKEKGRPGSSLLLVAGAAALGLAACTAAEPAGAPGEAPQRAFRYACQAISIANDTFVALAPALLQSGSIGEQDVAKERAVFAAADASCASPPENPETLATEILAEVATIYVALGR